MRSATGWGDQEVSMRARNAAFALLCLLPVIVGGCSEANRETAPVELIATVDQDIQLIDINSPPDPDADPIGTIQLRAIVKRISTPTLPVDTTFLDVQLRRYRVSYRRTDGGTLVPASFVRSISGIVVTGGGATPINDFLVFELDALSRAPFVALLPNNGGRDPETGRQIVEMDIIIDIFGETLSGEAVSARAVFPLTFCAGCTA